MNVAPDNQSSQRNSSEEKKSDLGGKKNKALEITNNQISFRCKSLFKTTRQQQQHSD